MRHPLPIREHPGLYLLPLDQAIPGFTDFIAAWLYRGETTVLVDPGPAATIPRLAAMLGELRVNRLDAILLTHVHIDHAGGVGHLAARFPDAPVWCHASAAAHLADPSRLWQGSLKTLGDTARAYGPPRPVAADRILDAVDEGDERIRTLATPGHAPHHVGYLVGDVLFAGEAGGVYHRLDGGHRYLRPATPPRFFLETSLASIDALVELPAAAICYGHFGLAADAGRMLGIHRAQLLEWAERIRREKERVSGADVVAHCVEKLLRTDALMAGWRRLPPEVRERERFFLGNSVRGFLGYLENGEGR